MYLIEIHSKILVKDICMKKIFVIVFIFCFSGQSFAKNSFGSSTTIPSKVYDIDNFESDTISRILHKL